MSGATERTEREQHAKSSWLKDNALLVGIIAAAIGFAGNLVVTRIAGSNALEVERKKFQSSLILEAIKTGDHDAARENLEFFLEAGLLDDDGGKIRSFLADRKRTPVLPSPDATPRGRSRGLPVPSLDKESPYHAFASAVGNLSFDGQVICSAFVVSDRHVVSFYHQDWEAGRLTLTMGHAAHEAGISTYAIKSPPVEANDKLHFAVFEVEGNPSEKYGTVPLTVRDPRLQEQLIAVHYSARTRESDRGGFSLEFVLTDGRCVPVAPILAGNPAFFGHECDTGGGSAGAPIFAASDRSLVGIHHSGSPGDSTANAGTRFTAILRVSTVLKRLADKR